MNKATRNTTKTIIAIVLSTILCSAWALAPLWLNPCIPTHLSEDELEEIHAQPSWKDLTLEQQAETDQLYREAEIPCGAQDLPTRGKLEASRFQGMIFHELTFKSLILRFELVDTDGPLGGFYFKAYTFFYIPLYRAFGGGSGYMEIDMLPFETHEGIDIGDWK